MAKLAARLYLDPAQFSPFLLTGYDKAYSYRDNKRTDDWDGTYRVTGVLPLCGYKSVSIRAKNTGEPLIPDDGEITPNTFVEFVNLQVWQYVQGNQLSTTGTADGVRLVKAPVASGPSVGRKADD
jgi:hypothetical protein